MYCTYCLYSLLGEGVLVGSMVCCLQGNNVFYVVEYCFFHHTGRVEAADDFTLSVLTIEIYLIWNFVMYYFNLGIFLRSFVKIFVCYFPLGSQGVTGICDL